MNIRILIMLSLLFISLTSLSATQAGQLKINIEANIQKQCEIAFVTKQGQKKAAYTEIERTCNIPHNVEISLNKRHTRPIQIKFAGREHVIMPGKRIYVMSRAVANKIDRLSIINTTDTLQTQKGLAQLHINIIPL